MTTSGGGWTVIQRRLDGSVDFHRGWQDYKNGFGHLDGEFWLGLEQIRALTASKFNQLRIDLEDFSGNTRYAIYQNVSIADEANKYRLSIGSYSGSFLFNFFFIFISLLVMCLHNKKLLVDLSGGSTHKFSFDRCELSH